MSAGLLLDKVWFDNYSGVYTVYTVYTVYFCKKSDVWFVCAERKYSFGRIFYAELGNLIIFWENKGFFGKNYQQGKTCLFSFFPRSIKNHLKINPVII